MPRLWFQHFRGNSLFNLCHILVFLVCRTPERLYMSYRGHSPDLLRCIKRVTAFRTDKNSDFILMPFHFFLSVQSAIATRITNSAATPTITPQTNGLMYISSSFLWYQFIHFYFKNICNRFQALNRWTWFIPFTDSSVFQSCFGFHLPDAYVFLFADFFYFVINKQFITPFSVSLFRKNSTIYIDNT